MSEAPDEELLAAFRDESAEALDSLLRLRDGWLVVSDLEAEQRILEAFRIFHNLKGAARFVGFAPVEPLAHAAEELLRGFHARAARPSDAVLERLAHAIMAILRHSEGTATSADLEAITESLAAEAAINDAASLASSVRVLPDTPPAGAASPVVRPTENPTSRVDSTPPAAPSNPDGPTSPEASTNAGASRATESVRVRATHLDQLMATTAELLTHHAGLAQREAKLEAVADAMRDAIRGVRGEAREAFVSSLAAVEKLLQDQRMDRQRLGHLSVELGDTVRKIRMMPLAGMVPNWRRITEDTAGDLGKRVRFEADVGDIAVDRRVLDGLRDPMMHLLRNAVDHGLEDPRVRAGLGKPAAGCITISARSSGTMVELTVVDDGAGIDVRALVARAVERGVISAERATQLGDEAARELAFAPGLSTAAQVTRISGRGIGLDVVRTRLTELGGTIELSAASGGGTCFRLELPVDVVQTTGLLARVGRTVVALPMTQVDRTVRVGSTDVRSVDGSAVLAREGEEPLRLLWLAELVGETREADSDSLMVVVVQQANARIGIVVAEVLGEAEFVLRPLPWNLGKVAGVAGAAVLGDGSIAVVLQVAALVAGRGAETRSGNHTVRMAESRRARCVLVVDDSVTSRILVRNILTTAGYEAVVANDGEEAWEILQRRAVDLVVTDVEMPRLDGHGLTRRIRRDTRTEHLPVIMVTSLARPEDIALGSAAGADEYIVKGRFDHRTLLEAVSRLG